MIELKNEFSWPKTGDEVFKTCPLAILVCVLELLKGTTTIDHNSQGKKLAERYIKNWQEHVQHSEVYVGRGR